jgi:peptidoglycan biosynthesis protein MviN/MurJ (putative lipid II flippase)
MNRVKVPAVVMPLGTLVYLIVAVSLTPWLGPQALAIGTSTASLALFVTLLLVLARQLPEIELLATASKLVLYAALAGAAMLAAAAGLARLEIPAVAVAAASLPLGTATYAAALYYGGDRTLRRLVEILRAYAARSTSLTTDDRLPRSPKAPPAPKVE